MAWTPPKTWTAGELVTAAALNVHLRDNELDLNTRVQAVAAPTLVSDDTQASNTTAGAVNYLHQYIVPAGTITPARALVYRSAGTFTAGVGSGYVRLVVGGTAYESAAASVSPGDHWTLELTLIALPGIGYRALSVATTGHLGAAPSIPNTQTIAFDPAGPTTIAEACLANVIGGIIYEHSFSYLLT
jgi:hypothetical protein